MFIKGKRYFLKLVFTLIWDPCSFCYQFSGQIKLQSIKSNHIFIQTLSKFIRDLWMISLNSFEKKLTTLPLKTILHSLEKSEPSSCLKVQLYWFYHFFSFWTMVKLLLSVKQTPNLFKSWQCDRQCYIGKPKTPKLNSLVSNDK